MSELMPIISAVKFILKVVQYVVPIVLIIFGSIDLVKAVIAGKEDDIKKNQQTLFKRIIAAVIVFCIPLIVSVVMGLIGSSEWKECWKNADEEINLEV